MKHLQYLRIKHQVLYLLIMMNACCYSLSLFSQTETIEYTQETEFFEEQQFANAQDFVFQTFEETSSLFKLDLTGLILRPPSFSSIQYRFQNSIRLDYERKFGQAFSLNTGTRLSYTYRSTADNIFYIGGRQLNITLEVQPRWYFKMKKKIAKGESANNLSGDYIGFGVEFWYARGNYQFNYRRGSIGLKYGIQRRIFGKGFIDLQFGPSFSSYRYSYQTELSTNDEKSKYFWFASQVRLGVVLGKPTLSLDASKRCDVFQCFTERKRMFKIDFLNLLNMTLSGLRSFSGSLPIGYEQKFAQYFSWVSEINTSYTYSRIAIFSIDPDSIGQITFGNYSLNLRFSFNNELRFYYDLKKRIANGKSANNLSGNYFALKFNLTDFLEKATGKPFGVNENIQLTIAPIWGLQRTIFKRGYINYSVGFNLLSYNSDFPNKWNFYLYNYNKHVIFQPFSQLRIGMTI